MNGYLIDTNVLSELRKDKRCDAGVRKWFEGTSAEELFVSVVVLGQIRLGIERIRLRDQMQAHSLEKWLLGLSTRSVTTFCRWISTLRINGVDLAFGSRCPFWTLFSQPPP